VLASVEVASTLASVEAASTPPDGEVAASVQPDGEVQAGTVAGAEVVGAGDRLSPLVLA